MSEDPIQEVEQEITATSELEVAQLEAIDPTPVTAFELWEQTVSSGGVDYGPWFYWFTAQWKEGIIAEEPLPPPVE
jgi:hypothetical protein